MHLNLMNWMWYRSAPDDVSNMRSRTVHIHNPFIVANNTSGCGRSTEQLSILKRAVASVMFCQDSEKSGKRWTVFKEGHNFIELKKKLFYFF